MFSCITLLWYHVNYHYNIIIVIIIIITCGPRRCRCYFTRMCVVCVILTWRARDGQTARMSCVDGTELDDGADRRWRRFCHRRRLPQGRPPPLARRALRNRDAASFTRPVISSGGSGGSASRDQPSLFVCLFVCVYVLCDCVCECLFVRALSPDSSELWKC